MCGKLGRNAVAVMLGPRHPLLHNGQLGSSLISFHHPCLQIMLTHTRLLN